MIFDAIFERDLFTVRRYAAGAKDALNRPTRTLLTETTANGTLQQVGTVEGETFVVDKFHATMPSDTDLRADDEVEAHGDRYTVEGSPAVSMVPGSRTIGILTAVLQYVGPVNA